MQALALTLCTHVHTCMNRSGTLSPLACRKAYKSVLGDAQAGLNWAGTHVGVHKEDQILPSLEQAPVVDMPSPAMLPDTALWHGNCGDNIRG